MPENALSAGDLGSDLGIPLKIPQFKPTTSPIEDIRRAFIASATKKNPAADTSKVSLVINALQRHRDSPELISSSLPRSSILADQLAAKDLRSLGFLPSYVAVPERGQTQLRTWRHPHTGMHFHRHDDRWIFHEDNWPSLSMQVEKFKQDNPGASKMDVLKYQLRSAFTDAAPHVVFEGTPGYINYISGMMTGEPGFRDRMNGKELYRGGMDQAARGLMSSLALGSAYGAATGSKRNVASGTGGSLGFLLGNRIANAIETRGVRSGAGYGTPGLSNLLLTAGLPAIGAAGGYIGGGKFYDKLFGQEKARDTTEKQKKKSRPKPRRLTDRQLAKLLDDPRVLERIEQVRSAGTKLKVAASPTTLLQLLHRPV